MDFISREHEKNFKELKLRFRSNDVEYDTACYITAVPMIFDEVSNYILGEAESPVDWIYAWEDGCLPQYDDEFDHEFEERKDEKLPFDLTGSMVELGRLALNLWNGYKKANLLDCINSVDEEHFQVILTAIKIRNGCYK